jgi:hypothetical protein
MEKARKQDKRKKRERERERDEEENRSTGFTEAFVLRFSGGWLTRL